MTKNNYDPDNLIMDMMQVPGFLEIPPLRMVEEKGFSGFYVIHKKLTISLDERVIEEAKANF